MSPFYAYQAFLGLFLCLSGLFVLIGAPRPFYACQSFLCLPAHAFPFMLAGTFYAYQRTSCSKSCLSEWKKNEIDLSRNDGFFGDGLSGSIFCSRQDDGWYLLDLPVLNTSQFLIIKCTPLSGIDHNSYSFFCGLRAMLIFSRRPQYIKNAQ